MDLRVLIVLLTVLSNGLFSLANEPQPISKITVMGTVFCDTCSNNTFSRHSYFLPGVEVHVKCKFKANSTTKETVSFSANRTTDRYGVYTFEVPHVDGFECRESLEIGSFCQASLLGSSSSLCNVPGLRGSTEHMAIKSKQANLCIYSLNALSYRPPKRYSALCRLYRGEVPISLNSSEFFLPYYPPFGFPFPPLPPLPSFPLPPFPPLPSFPLPPFPHLPPFPSFPLPPFPHLPPFPSLPFPPFNLPPMPFPNPPPAFQFPFPPFPPLTPIPSLFTPPPPPALPFPFPPFPPLPPTPSLFTPSPPPPTLPFPFSPFPPLPPTPSLFRPSPPGFSLRDPRSWFPFLPPFPPNNPQNQQP
ncbi:uncharacterized protein LOC143861913 [Tasmannia lanceolata]|uniref:uncharacterized protein LOC143861913 n=1 Tax=Tasmannia lanceolata TaxID=3420 RepID=UPI0040640A80